MRYIHASFAFVAALLFGCAVDVPTNPDTFNLDPGRASHLHGAQAIAIRNAHTSPAKGEVKLNNVTWVFDLVQLTDTGIAMLKRGLEKDGLKVADDAEKSVALRVVILGAGMRGFAVAPQTTARIGLEARFGDGTLLRLSSDNTSPGGAQRAFDGAVLFALNKLLVNEKFIAYMKK